MPIYDSYEKGVHYTNDPLALELQKYAHLPRKQFIEKLKELKEGGLKENEKE